MAKNDKNSTWLILIIAAGSLLFFVYFLNDKKIEQTPATNIESNNSINKNEISREVDTLGELSQPVVEFDPNKPIEQTSNTENKSDTPLPSMYDRVGVDPNNIPEDLPEDLKEQLTAPQELPEDLKAQLQAPPPEIPEDIKQQLSQPPREVTLDEINNPKN